MTLKKQMEIANAILEKLNEIMPGEYMAIPEYGLTKLMLKTGGKKAVIYIVPEWSKNEIEGAAKDIAEKLEKMHDIRRSEDGSEVEGL